MNRFVCSVLGIALLASCGKLADGVSVGGETHFLVTCAEGCGEGLSCIDGVCTRGCEPGFSSCSELASAAGCVSSAPDDVARTGFSGTCDVLCDADPDCAALGAGYACRSGACRAEPEQVALPASRPGARLARAVDADTCQSGLRWMGGNRPSAEMLPGSDCVGCHRDEGARPLMFGGTVYATASGLVGKGRPDPLEGCFGIEGIEVVVVDDNGRERSSVTNRAGNFYFEGRESELVWPYEAAVRFQLDGKPVQTPMATRAVYGGCARCHSAAAEATGSGLDFPDPNYVIPAFTVIFPAGLYRD